MKYPWPVLLLISLSFGVQPLSAQGTQTLLERVRFCTNSIICFGHTQSEYRHWADNNVAPEKQKRTYLSRYTEPHRNRVEHLVFLSAGQQMGQNSRVSNLLTGQDPGFARRIDGTDEEGWETIDTRSIAYRLFQEGYRDPSNTFTALAFDARFNYDFTANNKVEIVNAYYDWLKSKFIVSNLKSIYLAGHSRGGALILHLAERFNRDYPEIPLIVHLFDPVLAQSQNELGVQNAKVDSPFRNDNGDTKGYECYLLDYNRLLRNKNRLRVFNFVSGDLAADILGLNLLDAHSAVYRSLQTPEIVDMELGWMRQRYFSLSHNNIARSTGLVQMALDDLETNGDPMIDEYCRTRPPTVVCNVSPQVSFGDIAHVTFSATGSVSQSGAPLTSYVWRFETDNFTTGPTLHGPGPHTLTLFRMGDISTLTAYLTITDAFGNSATSICTASILGDENPFIEMPFQ